MLKKNLCSALIILSLILFISCKKEKKIKEQKIAKALIMQIKGKVLISKEFKAPLEKWTPVKTKQVITRGTYLRTRSQSSCDLLLNNGTKIKIIQKSIVLIQNISVSEKGEQKSKFKLYIGSILSKSSKLVGNSYYSISTPTAIAGVRGTEFVVNATEDKTSVSVNEGKVWVKRNIALDAKQQNQQAKVIAKTATQEIELAPGQASDIKKQDNEKIKTAVEKAKKGEKINIEEIKKTATVKPRTVTPNEKKQFVIFEDIRKMPTAEKENYGVLLILAGPDTEIFINGKLEGKEMLMKIAKTGIYDIKITRNGQTIKNVKAEIKSKQKTEVKVADPVFFAPETEAEKKALQKAREKVFGDDKPNTNIDLDSPGKPFSNDKPNTGVNFENRDVKKEANRELDERSSKLRNNETTRRQREAVKKATQDPGKSDYGSGDDVMKALKNRRKKDKKPADKIFD